MHDCSNNNSSLNIEKKVCIAGSFIYVRGFIFE